MAEGTQRRDREVGRANTRASSWLAWSLAGLSLVLCAATIALYAATRSVEPPSTWGTGGTSAVFIFLVPFLALPIVGALIASRRPRNPIGWISLATGIFWMLALITGSYGVYGLVANPGSVPFPAAIGSLTEWIWAPALGLLGTFLVLLFPDGRLPSKRWRPVAWLSVAVIVLVSAGIALRPGRLTDLGGVRNPFGLEGYPWIADAANVIPALLPLCTLASALSLVLRYRRSGSEEREQIKWIAFAGSFVGLMSLITVVSALIFAPEFPDSTGTQPLWLGVLQDVELLSFAGIPVAVGIAVLRYRLYDIDVIINRTLLIAALFNPLRRRIQSFIDRRFYRRKYDARKTLEAFTAKLRDETDFDALNAELVGVVNETIQPAHVSLWLRPDPEQWEKRRAAIREAGHNE